MLLFKILRLERIGSFAVSPALGRLLEEQQQNKVIVTPIVGNEAGETAKELPKTNLKKVGKKPTKST